MKTIQLLCLLVLLAGQGLFAQTTTTYLLIHKNDNTVDSISLADVDSLTHAEVTTIVSGSCGGQTSITYNGYTYQLVEIGTQCWFAENLRTANYQNGDAIPNITDATQWINLTTGAWSYYDNNSGWQNLYGKYYNWFAVSDSRNVCPLGWRVPSASDWSNLFQELGGESIAGGKLKNTSVWAHPNTGANNSSGFTANPGGLRSGWYGQFSDRGYFGIFWSETEVDSLDSWRISISYGSEAVSGTNRPKQGGLSVRCVKD